MKKKFVLFLIIVFLDTNGIFTSKIYANSAVIEPLNEYLLDFDTNPAPKKHIWELGTELFNLSYKEPDMMKEKGMLYGVIVSYMYTADFMFKAETRGNWGKVDYSYLGGTDWGTVSNISDTTAEIRGLAGYNFVLSRTFTLTPYLGLGDRYLNDDMAGKFTSGGLPVLKTESNYLYVPLGINITDKIAKGWNVILCLEYDRFLRGKHKRDWTTYYPELFNFPVVTCSQKKGVGYMISLELIKKGAKTDFCARPFIRHWNIRNSEMKTFERPDATWSFIQPKNSSTETGIAFSVRF